MDKFLKEKERKRNTEAESCLGLKVPFVRVATVHWISPLVIEHHAWNDAVVVDEGTVHFPNELPRLARIPKEAPHEERILKA